MLHRLHIIPRLVRFVDWTSCVHFFIRTKQNTIYIVAPHYSTPISADADFKCLMSIFDISVFFMSPNVIQTLAEELGQLVMLFFLKIEFTYEFPLDHPLGYSKQSCDLSMGVF